MHGHPSSLSSSDLCAAARFTLESIEISDCASFSCPQFYYAYGDGSFVATLYRHSVSIPTSPPALVLRNFTFGCAHSALGAPVRVAGFGRGSLSLLVAPVGQPVFLLFGVSLFRAGPSSPTEPSHPRVEGESVRQRGGGVRVHRDARQPEASVLLLRRAAGNILGSEAYSGGGEFEGCDGRGNGEMVVDSGTTFTMLPAGLYGSVVAEFEQRLGQVHKQATEIEDKTGLSPCYHFENDTIVGAVVTSLFNQY
ncbi:hypothetical protein NL676_016161 [Syzygium grande]|nr:hypothetical protein NL676_016161 [Syzygium grande]